MLSLMVASAVLGLSVPRAPSQPVELRPRFAAGEVIPYDVEASFRVRSEGSGGEARQTSVEQAARIRLTVRAVEKDGSATLELTFDRLTASGTPAGAFDGGGDAAAAGAVSWIAWSGDGPPPAAPEGGPPLAAMYHTLAGARILLDVSAQGEVEAVRGLRPVLEAGEGATWESRSRALGLLAPGAIKSNLSMIWRLDPGRATRPRLPGDSWAITDTLSLGESGEVEITTRCTLDGGTSGDPVITGATSARFVPPAGDQALPRPRLEITKAAGALRAVWDRAGGRVGQREDSLDLAWKAALDLSDPISASSVSTTRIKFEAVTGPLPPSPLPEPPAEPPPAEPPGAR